MTVEWSKLDGEKESEVTIRRKLELSTSLPCFA